ncbi:MAG: glycosyltransferase [Verrucomicrobiae bacterium]|nr:glycosyltransferase [Verrucomicrobiae bacterium]
MNEPADSKPSEIAFFIPSYNVERQLCDTVDTIRRAVSRANLKNYQIIIGNDGSTDQTGEMADQLARSDARISVIHNQVNRGMGATFIRALEEARSHQILTVPGDNDLTEDTIHALLLHRSEADMIVPYYLNREIRSRFRNGISEIYCLIFTLTFGVFLRYMAGSGIYPVEKLRAMKIKSRRVTIVPECNIKLILAGCTYFEVAGYAQTGEQGSTVVRLSSLVDVIKNFIRLCWEVFVSRKGEFGNKPKRIIPKISSPEGLV